MRIPAADVDETQPVLIAHEPGNALSLDGESARIDRAAVGLLHFVIEFLGNLLAQLQTIGHRRLQPVALIHGGEDRALALVERRFGHGAQRDVRDIRAALKK